MLTGKNCSLRALESHDAEVYQRWINDNETNFWRGLYHPSSESDARMWVTQESKTESHRLTFAIETVEGVSVGFIGLREICSRSRRAEMWIYIGEKSHWGRGIGSCAVGLLCRYAFNEMNLHRVWLLTNPENVGAVRCYERNGFRVEGVLRDYYFRRGRYWHPFLTPCVN